MDWDKDYEFNAPKYIDFLANDPENERLDSWFGKKPFLAWAGGLNGFAWRHFLFWMHNLSTRC